MNAPPPARLEGELSFATVPYFLAHAEALLDGGALDLRGVTHADSAGLALLLELTRRQRARDGSQLRLVGAQRRLERLAKFFGLDAVLRFDEASVKGDAT